MVNTNYRYHPTMLNCHCRDYCSRCHRKANYRTNCCKRPGYRLPEHVTPAYRVVWWKGGTRRRIPTGTSDGVRARQSLPDFQAKLERRLLKLAAGEAPDWYVEARATKVVALKRLTHAARALKLGFGDLRVDQINQSRSDHYAAQRFTRPPVMSLSNR